MVVGRFPTVFSSPLFARPADSPQSEGIFCNLTFSPTSRPNLITYVMFITFYLYSFFFTYVFIFYFFLLRFMNCWLTRTAEYWYCFSFLLVCSRIMPLFYHDYVSRLLPFILVTKCFFLFFYSNFILTVTRFFYYQPSHFSFNFWDRPLPFSYVSLCFD